MTGKSLLMTDWKEFCYFIFLQENIFGENEYIIHEIYKTAYFNFIEWTNIKWLHSQLMDK